MEPECPSTVTDLVEVLSLEKKTRYECSKFINEDIGVAVDDGQHNVVTHLAKAISIKSK